jgi:hypothetical protein
VQAIDAQALIACFLFSPLHATRMRHQFEQVCLMLWCSPVLCGGCREDAAS